MSIFKQMEETQLTPEEIQELLILLNDVIPKITSKLSSDRGMTTLESELKSRVKNMEIPNFGNPKLKSLMEGLERLKSVQNKLKIFTEILK